MSLSPIILFVYKRLWHTRQTIQSLQKNKLAEESDLYIFSDGPKRPSEKDQVDEVRNYINSITGFKEVIIRQSDINLGLANSVISGISKVIREHKKVIILEDDLIISPNFLKFMNESLNFYEDNQKIFSISGYSFPIKIPFDYTKDIYILPRSSSWGWGTWSNRWKIVDWDVKDYQTFLNDKNIQRLFNLAGDDLSPMLKAQMNSQIDSWAIKWAYAHFKEKAYCLFPIRSKILNIGTDKSGTHFKTKVKKYDTKLDNGNVEEWFSNDINPNEEILEEIRRITRLSLIRKIINYFKYDFINRAHS